VVLCPDALCFEERRHPRLENRAFEEFSFLRYVVNGKCLAWKNILDIRRAVDYLCSRSEVDAERIGCYGHSMGATFTWLVGPWEPRIKCLAANACLPTYAAIYRHYMLHCYTNFIPGFYQYGDTPDIVALIAPRPLHLSFGETDPMSPRRRSPASIRNNRCCLSRARSRVESELAYRDRRGPRAQRNHVGEDPRLVQLASFRVVA
jgi:dienelactone hydrolase